MEIEAIERARPKTGREAFDVLLLLALLIVLILIAAS